MPPPQCCLPAGVDILVGAAAAAPPPPRTYTVVLTEGDGAKVFAACLAFYDAAPPELRARHPELRGGGGGGARALKAVCLLSRRPYLATAERALKALHALAFAASSSGGGARAQFADAVAALLSAPAPAAPLLAEVRLRVGGAGAAWISARAPPAGGRAPPGELSFRPLADALGARGAAALFLAVLLERRVLLRSARCRLLALVAEAAVALLRPLAFRHVYVPVVPCSLVDLLEAPTPFLMGLHLADGGAGAHLAPLANIEGLIVFDLDGGGGGGSGSVHTGGDALFERCLRHPYARRLAARLEALLHPSVGAGAVGEPADPWVAAARAAAAAGGGWGARGQALFVRLFLEFFADALDDHEKFVSHAASNHSGGAAAAAVVARHAGAPRVSAGGAPAAAGVSSLLVHAHSGCSSNGGGGRLSKGMLRASSSFGRLSALAGGAGGACGGGSGACGGGGGALSVDVAGFLAHHGARTPEGSDQALVQQLAQGLPFYCFAEERMAAAGTAAQRSDGAGGGWLAEEEAALDEWLAAEESFERAQRRRQQQEQQQQQHGEGGGDEEGPGVFVVPDPPQGLLAPPPGAAHRALPPLLLAEPPPAAGGVGRLRRRTSGLGQWQRRRSTGRRRAMSELSVRANLCPSVVDHAFIWIGPQP